MGCLRSLYLERKIDYFVEPRKQWYSIRGTLLHAILENPGFAAQIDDMRRYVYSLFKTGEASREDLEQRWIAIEAQLADFANLLPKRDLPNWQSETEYELPIYWMCRDCRHTFGTGREELATCPACGSANIVRKYIRGTIDVLRPETGELLDYKTIGDKGLGVIIKGAKPDHIMQFNMYRLLVERGYPVGEKDTYTPIKIKKITSYYLTMMDIVTTGGLLSQDTDWLVADGDAAKRYENGLSDNGATIVGFPEVIGEKEQFKTKKGKRKDSVNPDDFELQIYRKFRVTYAIPEVPLMNLDEVEQFIREKSPVLFNAFEHGLMPDMCSKEMREWKCESYCPDQIRHACDEYNTTVGVQRVEGERSINKTKKKDFIPVGQLLETATGTEASI